MAKVSTYMVERYDGGLPASPTPWAEGVFELSDADWRLHFRNRRPAVACGLLRSRFDVEQIGRRRSRVTIHGESGKEFRGSFVVRASASRLRDDLDRRSISLQRTGEVVAAVNQGQWWMDARVFDGLGWSRTRSVCGVRCHGGQWGTRTIRRSRVARVLDFGPDGVSLRGWRTRTLLTWEGIAALEVNPGAPFSRRGKRQSTAIPDEVGTGASIVVRSHLDDRISFHTLLAAPMAVAAELDPLIEHLARSTTRRPPGPTDGSGARPVPEWD